MKKTTSIIKVASDIVYNDGITQGNILSFGNKKLPKTTMIFNFGSATECPSKKLGLCKVVKICYAMKAERMYKSVLPYRNRQLHYWTNTDARTIADNFIAVIRKKKVKALRFSEAGDFYNQANLYKFTQVCQLIKAKLPELRIYGYSARHDLDFTELKKYAVIQGSGFVISNAFTVVNEIDTSKPFCKGDCKTCNLCQFETGLNIQVKKH